jgi:hypothetical protein
VDLLVNPDLDGLRPALLQSLNQCFPHWGGDDEFRWQFLRTVGRLQTDFLIARDAGRVVAGSAVVYRPVRLATGQTIDAGIMASSWTLPEARGVGHFSRIIEESVRVTREKGAALLLAYVTSVNASSRRLLASGAAGVPTHYLIDEQAPTPEGQPPVVESPDASVDDLMNVSPTGDVTRFVYRPQEWREQFWQRANATRLVRVGDLGLALVETKNEFDRLLAFSSAGPASADCLAPLLAWSHQRGQRFFLFTTDDAWKDRAVRLGMRHLPGFLTVRTARETARPASAAGPARPDAGPWFIRGGDRM